MREIKFRAWDKKRRKMIYLSPEVDPKNCGKLVYCDMKDLAIGLDGYLYLLDECGNWECPESLGEEYEIMQYTGLKDKNGKEIYEGDIIQQRSEWDGITIKGKVVFRKGMFVLRDSREYYTERHYLLNKTAEVIGNIYENPELLKKERRK